jgi:hypothetical protein
LKEGLCAKQGWGMMIRNLLQSRIAGAVFAFALVTLAGGCASVDESGPNSAAINPAAPSEMSLQRGWLSPGPRGVAPCPMENIMECATPPSTLGVNGGV